MKICLILLWPLLTQALEFKAYVNKTEVGLNETFILNLQFDSKGSIPKQVSAPELFQLKDFHLLDESESQQSSIQIINGQMSKTSVFVKKYRFQPKAIGFFKIPALNVQADGKTFKTQPIVIKVIKDKPSTPSQAPKTAPGFPLNLPDPFNFPNSIFKGLPGMLSNQEKESPKLKLELSKNSVYKSERLRANWLTLSSSSSIHFDLFRIPKLKGFWKEKIKITNPVIGSEIIGKTLYRKQLIDSLWLFPLKSGELELDSYSIKFFSFFRDGRIISVPTREVRVKDLPSNGLDEAFTGAVGDFSIQYLLKENTGLVNEPLSLKIIFEGSGHPRFIDLPQIPFPSSVETYPPVKKSQFSNRGIGTKEFEILIVPKKEGQLIIPSFSLSTFNPKTGQYVFHKSPEFVVSIKSSKTNNNLGESFLNTTDEDKPEILSNYTPLEKSYWPSFISYKNLIWFFTGLFSFFVFVLLVVFIKKIILSRKQSLKEKVNNKLLVIQNLLDKKDWKMACIQMIQLGTYVLTSSHIQNTTSDWRQALKALAPSLNKKYSAEFELLFKKLESLSFSPHFQSSNLALKQAQKLLNQSQALINKFLTHL